MSTRPPPTLWISTPILPASGLCFNHCAKSFARASSSGCSPSPDANRYSQRPPKSPRCAFWLAWRNRSVWTRRSRKSSRTSSLKCGWPLSSVVRRRRLSSRRAEPVELLIARRTSERQSMRSRRRAGRPSSSRPSSSPSSVGAGALLFFGHLPARARGAIAQPRALQPVGFKNSVRPSDSADLQPDRVNEPDGSA
jgi:hypothetical protein